MVGGYSPEFLVEQQRRLDTADGRDPRLAVVDTLLGHLGLSLSFLAERALGAVVNYWRFRSGEWKAISDGYRPRSVAED